MTSIMIKGVNIYIPDADDRKVEYDAIIYNQWLIKSNIPRSIKDVFDVYHETKTDSAIKDALDGGAMVILLYGPPRTGKSCASAYALRRMMRGVYVTADQYCISANSFTDKWLQSECLAYGHLVLDDVGQEDEKDSGKIERLITHRYGDNKTTIMSTNLTGDEFKRRYTDRVIARIKERGAMIKCDEIRGRQNDR